MRYEIQTACSRDKPPGGGASLERLISLYNEVRFIDAFVDSLPLEKLGFRSSRCLERECGRNLEVMWLLGQLAPDHNTITNFRKKQQPRQLPLVGRGAHTSLQSPNCKGWAFLFTTDPGSGKGRIF